MSQRANPVAIGLFFAIAIALLVGVLFFFGGGDLLRKHQRFVVYFDGSITGLRVGAPVSFQGVQIGQVADIHLGISADGGDIVIPVLVDIDRKQFPELADNTNGVRDRLIERGLRAQLKLQSVLTSLLFIELDFYPGSALRYRAVNGDYTELPTVPTPLQALLRNVESLNINELIHASNRAVAGIDKLVNHPDAAGSLVALRQLLQDADAAVVRFDREAVPALQDLRKTLARVESLSAALQKDYPAVSADLQRTLQDLRSALGRFDAVTAEAQFLLSEDSALYRDVQQAVRDVSNAARSVDAMGDTISREPEALLRGKSTPAEEK